MSPETKTLTLGSWGWPPARHHRLLLRLFCVAVHDPIIDRSAGQHGNFYMEQNPLRATATTSFDLYMTYYGILDPHAYFYGKNPKSPKQQLPASYFPQGGPPIL